MGMRFGFTKRGFSLIEAVIGVLLIAIVALGLISAVVMSRHIAEYDKQRLAAISVARTFAEQIQQGTYPAAQTVYGLPLDNFNTPDELDDLQASLDIRKFYVNANGTRGTEITGRIEDLPLADQDRRIVIVLSVSWNRTGSRSSTRVTEELHLYKVPDLST